MEDTAVPSRGRSGSEQAPATQLRPHRDLERREGGGGGKDHWPPRARGREEGRGLGLQGAGLLRAGSSWRLREGQLQDPSRAVVVPSSPWCPWIRDMSVPVPSFTVSFSVSQVPP